MTRAETMVEAFTRFSTVPLSTTALKSLTPIERVLVRTRVVFGCWEFLGPVTNNGYGQIMVDRERIRTHRLTYQHFYGPIPEGLELDHLCRNPACVRPSHLEAVTHRENTLRGDSMVARQARQTHCKRGHEFTPENTMRKRDGSRNCRACRSVASRKTDKPFGHAHDVAAILVREDMRRQVEEQLALEVPA